MVLFQFYGSYQGGGGMFSNMVYWLQYWGVRDIILPFVLIFTIFFAVLQRIHLFGLKDKKYNVAISIAIALLVVIPHATGAYPPGKDVVNIINDSIPEVALLVIVVVLLLMLLGLGVGKAYGYVLTGWIAFAAGIVLVLIFLNSLFPLPIINYIDPSIQALIVILLVFGIIVWFVTREPPKKKGYIWEKIPKEITEEEEEAPAGGGGGGGGTH